LAESVLPPGNGSLAAYRSFVGGAFPAEEDLPEPNERFALTTGAFFPDDVVDWMQHLPYWYEDDHAIYVHAGLPKGEQGFLHPLAVKAPIAMLWCRDEDFFRNYRGKRVVFGHTRTEYLPPELSGYTPEDPSDLWAGVDVVGIDTGCGKGGFLTALELPSMNVYESR
jgi:serine/threonine protein phosphatase 1